MRAIRVDEFGGPEVLLLAEVPDPVQADGMVIVDVTGAGVNYADTHQAENSYLAASTLPLIPGAEVVGLDPDGRRVVALVAGGGYAERVAVDPRLAFPVPEGVSDAAALALVLQGTTAWSLLRRMTHLQAGESVVVHAGAGGVGNVAIQLARAWGAGRIIATASSVEKRELTLTLGADAAVDPAEADLTSALRAANNGRGVDVVLEMTGGRVTDSSLAALAPFGRLAFYGMASREAPTPIAPGALMARSATVAGFWLAHLFRRPDVLAAAMQEMFEMVLDGRLAPVHGGTYPLAQARLAHEELRARRTTGKVVLDPRL